MRAVLTQVAAAPPKRFAGGGYWVAMKGEMTGWFEVRVNGPRRYHYRLFCRLDYEAKDRPKPLLIVICGLGQAVPGRNWRMLTTSVSGTSVRSACAGTRAH